MLTSTVKSVSLKLPTFYGGAYDGNRARLFARVKAAELKGSTIRPACSNAEMHGVSLFDRVNVEVSSVLDGRIYIRRNPSAPQQFRLDGSFPEGTYCLVTQLK